MSEQAKIDGAAGMAALGICESLLLALTDLDVMSEVAVRDVLRDVATAHQEAATVSQTPEVHRAVVEIIERIVAGKNGLRH